MLFRSVSQSRYSKDKVKYGPVEGANIERASHELGIAEALLWYMGKYKVHAIVHENDLKSGIVKSKKKNRSKKEENTGDFKVLLEDVKTGQTEWEEGEIAVDYRSKKIKAKPDDMQWFAYDKTQIERIKAAKSQTYPELIGDVCAPIEAEELFDKMNRGEMNEDSKWPSIVTGKQIGRAHV